jgi:hypothetical protein
VRDAKEAEWAVSLDSPRDESWPKLAAESATIAKNCDELDVVVSNTGSAPIYVAGFYIDSRGGVLAIDHRDPGKSVSDCHRLLRAGEVIKLSQFFGTIPQVRPRIVSWIGGKPQSAGIEHLALIAIPLEGLSGPPDLCKLSQPSQAVTTRGVVADAGDKAKLLNDLMDGVLLDVGTRGLRFHVIQSETRIAGQVFTVDLRP